MVASGGSLSPRFTKRHVSPPCVLSQDARSRRVGGSLPGGLSSAANTESASTYLRRAAGSLSSGWLEWVQPILRLTCFTGPLVNGFNYRCAQFSTDEHLILCPRSSMRANSSRGALKTPRDSATGVSRVVQRIPNSSHDSDHQAWLPSTVSPAAATQARILAPQLACGPLHTTLPPPPAPPPDPPPPPPLPPPPP